jgi:hypothetical protein
MNWMDGYIYHIKLFNYKYIKTKTLLNNFILFSLSLFSIYFSKNFQMPFSSHGNLCITLLNYRRRWNRRVQGGFYGRLQTTLEVGVYSRRISMTVELLQISFWIR